MPAPPRWLLAVPDAIRQLEALDRDLLTRRDVERLFGVSRARAAQRMRTFGAARVGATSVSFGGPRSCGSCGSTGSGPRSAARRSGARAWWPRSARRGSPGSGWPCRSRRSRRRLACPRASTSRRDRIEVRFSGAQEAVARLFALAQALTNDYDRFETLVGRGEVSE